ncbi:MAG: ABC transporter ATP-binding protein [Syntrophomonadaceae bacterium]|nr:ABC transporter ATP-binding protein [Syntrophomonadaceae bacterium]MDD3024200.1 ABC transporter ATP-binding protein [Syntrophomonadaceae bacterium]
MLIVEDLCKSYGKFVAVDNLSFKVNEGSIFGFVGPNGAGKTTTMRILATLLRPSSGRAWVAGEEVTARPKRIRQLVGYMPDFFGVYDDLKVDEYLDFYSASYGIPMQQRKKIIDELLELMDLSHKREAYVDSLSRGMKQRLCLARCLVHDPALLILDEPASGLDPRARVEVREILKELKSMGKTIIISSHILPELTEMCSHVGIIEAGKMVVSAPVDQIVNRSLSRQVLEIRVLDRLEQTIGLLQEMGYTAEIAEGNILEMPFTGDQSDMNHIIKALVQADIPLVSFAESKSNLENIFMELTKGVVQ